MWIERGVYEWGWKQRGSNKITYIHYTHTNTSKHQSQAKQNIMANGKFIINLEKRKREKKEYELELIVVVVVVVVKER